MKLPKLNIINTPKKNNLRDRFGKRNVSLNISKDFDE